MPGPKPKPPKPKPLRSSSAVSLRALAQIDPALEGAKSRTFRMVANTGEPMRIYPYEHPVVVDLATIDLSGLPLPSLYDHYPDADFIVGQVKAGRVQGSDLITDGVFIPPPEATPPERNYHDKVLARADAGYQWQVSVGGDPTTVEEVKAGGSVLVNGRTYPGPVCVARGLVLREISFVVLGGDRRTSAVVASNGRGAMKAASFSEWLSTMSALFGADPEKLDETQQAAAKIVYESQNPGGEEPAAEAAAEGDAMPEEEEEVAAEGEEEEVAAEGDTETEEETPTNAAAKPPALKAKGGKAKQRIEAETRAAVRAATAAEMSRHRALNALSASYGNPSIPVKGKDGKTRKVPFAEHAIEAGWDVTRGKAALLDVVRQRPSGPGVIVTSHAKSCTLQSLQGAMILRAGGKLDHKSYKGMGGVALLGKVAPWLLRDINDADRNRYMEAAHRYSNMSMVDLCRESLRLNSQDIPHEREDMIRAAFSGGGNLTNVFTTNVNAILLATYDEFQDDTTMGWVSEQDVNDYKTNERPRVQVSDGLKKLARGEEAQHTSYTDLLESYKIAKYARQFEIDEQDVIDDSFGVFQDTPKAMGMAAARLRPDLVYGAVVLANPTLTATGLALFSDSNTPDNLRAASTFAHAALSASLAAMRLGRENSVNLNFEASHLIVPPSLEDLAIELTQSINIIAGGDTGIAIRGETNSLSRRGLAVVTEPRLENGVINPADETSQSGSATSWFLACARAHTIEVGYLRGTGRAPRVRTTVLDKGRWGVNWDVELSIGVKALDFKGLFKMTT